MQAFCKVMSHINHLDMSNVYSMGPCDGMMIAIVSSMHQLKSLYASNLYDEAHSLECLIPGGDNLKQSCPELEYLSLNRFYQSVDLKFIKKLLLGLPKLRYVECHMHIDKFLELTDEELNLDIKRNLSTPLHQDNYRVHLTCAPSRRGITHKSHLSQVIPNITSVEIGSDLKHFIPDVLKLKRLKSVILRSVSESNEREVLLPFLESNGTSLEYLNVGTLSGNLTVRDIMRTCPILVELLLGRFGDRRDPLSFEVARHNKHCYKNEPKSSSERYVLHNLRSIKLGHLDKQVCSKDMMISLLLSPRLKKISVMDMPTMNNDVMFQTLSSSSRISPMSQITNFFVHNCSAFTEAPVVCWLGMTSCKLEAIVLTGCPIDFKVLLDAVRNYPRDLKTYHLEENYANVD